MTAFEQVKLEVIKERTIVRGIEKVTEVDSNRIFEALGN